MLGASEDTAGKRIQRALEKLRRFFLKRGVASTIVMIAGAMAANSVQAAPAGLSAAIAAAGSGKGIALASSTTTLIQGTLKLMAWTKLKTTLVVGAAVLLAGGSATVTVIVARHAVHAYLDHQTLMPDQFAPPRRFVTKTVVVTRDGAHVVFDGQDSVPDQNADASQLAKALFEALGRGDWKTIARLCPPGTSVEEVFGGPLKEKWAGLTVLSLGKPFTRPGYAGVYVPYEIRYKNGEVRKWNLAVRCDNPERRWYWDGGL